MPAPTATLIEQSLTNALLQAGYYKKVYQNDEITIDQSQLPDELQKLVKAQSIGLAVMWAQWQAAQTVTIPVTSPAGSPSTGKLFP